jgi:Sulfotransferase domain
VSHLTLLTSYPRSGNTWARIMLASYAMNAPVTSREMLEDTIPDLRLMLESGRVMPPRDGSRPQIVKTHFLPDAEVMQLYRTSARKVLYLVRNPRDVIISALRFLRVPDMQKAGFAKEFIANRGVPLFRDRTWGTWPEHVFDWTSPERVRRHFPDADVIVVRYEDMRDDPAGKLREILEFLDPHAPIEPARVQRATENSSLEKVLAAQTAEGKGTRGLGAFHIGQGLQNQSLAVLGEDVEAAYQQLLLDDEEFFLCAKQFGYAK